MSDSTKEVIVVVVAGTIIAVTLILSVGAYNQKVAELQYEHGYIESIPDVLEIKKGNPK